MLYSKVIYAQQNIKSVKKYYIESIDISGNKKTKDQTILRELTFSVTDSILFNQLDSELKKSKQNLLNSPLFNFVDININTIDSVNIKLTVTVEERWYLWPEAAIYYTDRNFSNWLKEGDLSHLDIGLGIVKYNFRGRNEKLSIYTFFGYDQEFLFYYEDLYLDNKRRHSLSLYFESLKRKKTPCIISNDVLQQLKLENEFALRSNKVRIKYMYRKEHYNSHSFYLGFENRKISDSLLICNPNYLNNPEYPANFFRLKYIFQRDMRNSRLFPTDGYKLSITLNKNGLMIFPDSEINSFYIKTDVSLYKKINDRFSYNTNITLKKTFGNINPFFLNTALGYSSSIRAYEYYVVNGRDMALVKNTLYLKLLSKKYIYLKFIPWERFNKIHFTIYGGVFSDFAYVVNDDLLYNQINNFANTLLYSAGFGLNIVTYYDKLLRVEYSLNKEKKGGVYLHFEAPF